MLGYHHVLMIFLAVAVILLCKLSCPSRPYQYQTLTIASIQLSSSQAAPHHLLSYLASSSSRYTTKTTHLHTILRKSTPE